MEKILSVAILLVLFSTATAHAGQVTLSTYYPAPFGSYDRMKLVPRAALADTYCQDRPSNASMYYTENRTGEPDSVRYCLDNGTTRGWVPYPGVWTQTHTTSDSVFLTDTTVNSDLKVGIGTTAPSQLLSLYGGDLVIEDTGLSHAVLYLDALGTADPIIRFQLNQEEGIATYVMGVDNSDSDKFKIQKAWNLDTTSPGITIDNSGNVGIGTTNPESLLEVNGPIKVHGQIRLKSLYPLIWKDGAISGCRMSQYTICPGNWTTLLNGATYDLCMYCP